MTLTLALACVLTMAQDPGDQTLGTAPPGSSIKFFEVAPKTGRLLFVAKVGGEEVIYVDGKEAARGAQILGPRWSPEGSRWSCFVKDGDGLRMVVDGVRMDPTPLLGEVVFSLDGRHLAYVTGERGRQAAVLDGVRQKEYAEVENLVFGGARLGFIARKGDQSLIILDGVEKAASPRVSQLALSPDGKQVAYAASTAEGTRMILDDKPSRVYYEVGRPVFSADGARLAYEAHRDGNTFLVVDGKESDGIPSHTSQAHGIAFSPDGRHVAWRIDPDGKDPLLFVDGTSRPAIPCVYHFPMIFSSDGKRLAYVGQEGSTMLAVVDGTPSRQEVVILSPLVLSPDGRRYAYTARDRNFRQFVVVDGKQGPFHDEVREPIFSPDSSRLTYVARNAWDFQRKVFSEAPLARPEPPPRPVAPPTSQTLPPGFRERIGSAKLFHLRYGPGVMAFTPDGKQLATTGGKEIRVWSVETGDEVQTLAASSGTMTVAVSPDGRLLAAGLRNRTVELWDLAGGRVLQTLTGNTNEVTSIVFTPDSKRLVTALHGPDVRVWDAATGVELYRLKRHGEYVPQAGISSDGKILHTVPKLKSSLYSWNLEDGSALREIPIPQLSDASFSPAGRYVSFFHQSFSTNPSQVKIFDLDSGNEVSSFDVFAELGVKVAWSGDETSVAVACREGHVSVRDRSSGRELHDLSVGRVDGLVFSPDSKTLAVSWQGFVRLVELATGRDKFGGRHNGSVYSTLYAPDGSSLVTAGVDQSVRIWSPVTGKEIASFEGKANSYDSPVFLQKGKELLTIGSEKGLQVRDAATGKETRTIPVLFQSGAGPIAASDFAVSPDKTKVAVYWGARGGWLFIVDLATGKTLAEGTAKGLPRKGLFEVYRGLTFAPDGKTLIARTSDTSVVVWNAETANPWFTFETGVKIQSSPIYSPDGTKIITGIEDGTVRSWDALTGKPAGSFQAHKTGVCAFAFSPDGSMMATTGWDLKLRFWDWKTGAEVGTATTVPAQINAMAFSPDGKDLSVGGQDGTILVKTVPAR